MKKYFILVAAAVVALASCQKNDGTIQNVNDAVEGTPVGFSAYTHQSVTKGTIVTGSEVDSIGVFAFYQQNANGQAVDFNTHRYSVPDFMYNQLVSGKPNAGGTDSVWTYTPVKYWPNNVGDQLSFFAYAPYDPAKTWEDMGISTDAIGKTMTVSFPIYNKVEDQTDILWADPQVNKSNMSVGGDYTVPKTVDFNFKHITSRIALFVGVTDTISSSPAKWSDGSTTITVNSILFKGLGESIEYTYTMPVYATGDPVVKTKGKQDIALSEEDFINNTSDKWTAAQYYALIDSVTVGSVKEAGYMFVAPQKDVKNLAIEFTYTVETKDTAHPENSSTIVNTVKKTWNEFAEAITELGQGKAYALKFLIGMNSVKIDVEETPWAEETVHTIDVPKNK